LLRIGWLREGKYAKVADKNTEVGAAFFIECKPAEEMKASESAGNCKDIEERSKPYAS
jgi:hypothetical protein